MKHRKFQYTPKKSGATHPNIDFSLFGKAKELKERIIFVLIAILVFRFGSYIPLPGIDTFVLNEIASQNSKGILGMFNMLSGGSLGRMSIFSLAIMPYITASIIMQLLTMVSKTLENLKKEGESGRKSINQYTRIATVFLCAFQAYGISVGIESLSSTSGPLVYNPGVFFKVISVTTLVSGTIFLMWLGEQISARGIGNGTSLIIFSGIVAGLPNSLASTFDLAKTGAISGFLLFFVCILALAMVYFIVFVEKSVRKIVVQYPKRQIGNKVVEGDNSHIPLKINVAGVIPPIFSSALLLFPLTIVNFTQRTEIVSSDNSILELISIYLSNGKPLYIILYAALITIFSFFYSSIIFNAEETAENLRKYGGLIPGKRPGANTSEFLTHISTRLTVIGSVYLVIICVVPEVLIANYSVPFYLGGTSVLIVVNVIIDFIAQVQTHLFSHQYEGLMNKMKIKEKK